MSKYKYLIIIASILLIGGLGYFFTKSKAVDKNVEEFIQNQLPENLELTYDKISTNFISGNLRLKNAKLWVKDAGATILLDDFKLKNLDYSKLMSSDTVVIEATSFKGLHVVVDQSKKVKTQKDTAQKKQNVILKLGELNLQLSSLGFRDKNGILNAELDDTTINLKDVLVQSQPKKNTLPVQFMVKNIEADSLHFPLSKFQVLNIAHLKMDSTSLDLQDTHLVLKDKGIDVMFDRLALNGDALKKPLSTDSLIFDHCILQKGKIKINNSKKQTVATKDSLQAANKFILIKDIKIADTDFEFIDKQGKPQIDFKNTNAFFSDLRILTNPSSNQNSLTYNFIRLKAQNINFPMDLHTLKADAIHVTPEKVDINQLTINPDYDRRTFQQKLKEERDMIALTVPQVGMRNYEFSFDNDQPYLKAQTIDLNRTKLNVYRNKEPRDQQGRKPLYSEMLRKMNFELAINQINLNNADITYEEQQSFDRAAGKIFFKKFNGKINHLYNKKAGYPVTIDVNTLFMGHAPTHVIWKFNVLQPRDQYSFTGNVKNLKASALDQFLKPNLKATINGVIKETAFNFSGADWGAEGEMRMMYDDIKLEILNEKNEKKGFFSAVANLFVKNKRDEKRAVDYQVKVERDQEKSFFNLLWLFLKQGIKQNMVKFQGNNAKD